jgi:16S rRNA pseudouridine516 synthase
MQLERILQKHGFGTRKECRSLIRHNRVAVNGELCDDPFIECETAGLIFTVDGVDWPYAEFACLILNKPPGYECSRKPLHHPSVLTLLPVQLREREVQPIGRLDQDTTGLLLITTDEPEPIAAAACEIVGDHLLRMTLTGGKYHQVKRMVAAAGNRVEALHRETIAELDLPSDLKSGEWRWLSPEDFKKLGYSR